MAETVAGWVYVLTNPALPGIVKIGRTTRTATRRAVQLEWEYGAAAPWEVAARHAVPDCVAVEAWAHRLLDDRRLPRSELFRCAPAEASSVVRAAALAYRKPWAVTVWLRRLLHPPRSGYRPWRRRRGSRDGLLLIGLVAVLAAPVVLLKPDVPAWLPAHVARVARVALMLERWR